MTTHALPELYGRWAAEFLPGEPPDETKATCSDCTMCVKADGNGPMALYVFQPDVKCCVYMPALPNFLVGRTLAAEDGPGRRSIQKRIAAGIGVTPLALERPAAYDLPFRNSVNAMGRSKALRCPHFVEEGALCGIWRNRDATCSTWFCQHQRGPVGARFWSALRDLFATVETSLARWAAREEGIPADVLARYLVSSDHDRRSPPPDGPELDGVPDPRLHAALWGDRVGREAEYYRACADRVEPLSWSDIERIGGIEVSVRADLVRQRWAAQATRTLPERLAIGAFQVAMRRPGGVRAVTYSALDAIDLSDLLVSVLPLFDGRPVAEVRQQLLAERNVELDDGFLARLVDWGILTAA